MSMRINSEDRKNNNISNKKKTTIWELLLKIITKIKGTNSKSLSYGSFKYFTASKKNKIIGQSILPVNLTELYEKTVADIMIPRSDITAINHNSSLEEFTKLIGKFTMSRTLVYENNLDNIIGFVHIKDIVKILTKKIATKKIATHNNSVYSLQLKKIIRQPIIAATSIKIIDLLREMQEKKIYIALVVDEYGGTDGIVTINDIVSQIIGNINDEYQNKSLNNPQYKLIAENIIMSHARVEVEDLEEAFNIKLKNDEDEFHTIGGLVLAKVGSVPTPGTKIKISNAVEIEVIDSNPRILKQVKLTITPNIIDFY